MSSGKSVGVTVEYGFFSTWLHEDVYISAIDDVSQDEIDDINELLREIQSGLWFRWIFVPIFLEILAAIVLVWWSLQQTYGPLLVTITIPLGFSILDICFTNCRFDSATAKILRFAMDKGYQCTSKEEFAYFLFITIRITFYLSLEESQRGGSKT